MNRIDRIFADLRAHTPAGRALMPFVCGGHPGPGVTPRALLALQDAGAAVVEVGIPFSDPIADGPVIAAAMHDAIRAGSTPRSVLDEVASVRSRLRIGLVAMVSVSIVHRMGGPGTFVKQATQAGFDGLIVPDATLEESGDLLSAARAAGATLSLLVAPTTPPDRAAAIARACSGFVYLLARSGITGERHEAPDIADRVHMLRGATPLPIACGFGISTPEHVRAVVRHADAAIVGSTLVKRMDEAARTGRDPAEAAGTCAGDLARGLDGAASPA